MSRLLIPSLLMLALLAPFTFAQSLAVPAASATNEGDTTGRGMFYLADRTRQTYLHRSQLASLPNGAEITGLKVRMDGAWGTWTTDLTFASYDVQLSESSAGSFAANEFATNDFAANLGAGVTTVRSGSLFIPASSLTGGASPNAFSYQLGFSAPYTYTAGTDIVVTIRHTGNGSGFAPSLDESTAAAGVTDGISAAGYTAAYGTAGAATIMELQYTSSGANTPPTLALSAGTDFVAANDFELNVDPGSDLTSAVVAALLVNDTTPDPVSVSVAFVAGPTGATPPTGIVPPANQTIQVVTLPDFIAWTGTADASNAPGAYIWTVTLDDGASQAQYAVRIVIADLPPVHSMGADATSGAGTAASPYSASVSVGATAWLHMAGFTDPNTGQTLLPVTASISISGPTGGSGIGMAYQPDDLFLTPAAPLVQADIGTYLAYLEVSDGTNTTAVSVAVVVSAAAGAPLIQVQHGSTGVLNGDDISLSQTPSGQPKVETFSILNTGTAQLDLTGSPLVDVFGFMNCTVLVTSQPASSIAAGGSDSFTLEVTPLAPGNYTCYVWIANNDPIRHPFMFTVSGTTSVAGGGSATGTGNGGSSGGGCTVQETSGAYLVLALLFLAGLRLYRRQA